MYKSDNNSGKILGEEGRLGSLTVGKMAMQAVNEMDDFVSIVT